MRFAGIHTYLGGFQMGLMTRDDVEILGSYETWDLGLRARALTGLPTLAGHQPARVVFANPPCSRFTNMSADSFSRDQKSSIENFCEMGEVIEFTQRCGAEALWWESGPNLYGESGDQMILSAHAKMRSIWGDPVTTVVVKYDPRFSCVPQRRPRSHAFHLRGKITPPRVARTQWPDAPRLGEYIDAGLAAVGHEIGTGHVDIPRYLRIMGKDPREIVINDQKWSTFHSSSPDLTFRDDRYSVAVVSGRFFAWYEANRWWELEEYAVLQGMNPRMVRVLTQGGIHQRDVLKLMSKGLSTKAARGVLDLVALPMLRGESGPEGGIEAREVWENVYYMNLSVRDTPKRRETHLRSRLGET